jgi:membrane dipeptidase
MVQKTGVDHIALGSDFFGGTTPEGLEDVSKFPNLIAALVDRGWADAAIAKIASGNFIRLFRSVERTARALQKTEGARTGRIEDYDL